MKRSGLKALVLVGLAGGLVVGLQTVWAGPAEAPGACAASENGVLPPPLLACDPSFFATGDVVDTVRVDKAADYLAELVSGRSVVLNAMAGLALVGGGSGKYSIATPREEYVRPRYELRLSRITRTTCCNKKIVSLRGSRIGASIAFKAEQRFFYGIPLLGEVGIRLFERLGWDNSITLGLECNASDCASTGVGVGVAGEVYANALAGAVDVSGGVKADSSAYIRFCQKKPNFGARGEVGRIALTAQFSAAWGLYRRSWEGQIFEKQMPMEIFKL